MRSYKQNCSLARASDLLGERWTLLIIRDLLIAPRRFSELERRMRGIGTNLLAKRLKEMAASGLVVTSIQQGYALTNKGKALEPVVLGMIRWSLGWLGQGSHPDGLHYPDWDLLALKALYSPDHKLGQPITATFRHDHWAGWVTIDRNGYQCGLGQPKSKPDVDFPCAIPMLERPEPVLSTLPPSQRTKAREFIAAFDRGQQLQA